MDINKEQQYKERIADYERQLCQLANELTIAEERERREIACDLHDHIGQALAVMSNKLSRLAENAAFSGFEHDIELIRKLVRQTISYTRNLTTEISPPALYELGLEPALNLLASNFTGKSDMDVTVVPEGDRIRPCDETAVMLYKSVRELLRNALDHGEAEEAVIRIVYGKERLELSVEDNGKGFDAEILGFRSVSNQGFGLFSVKERVKFLGGDLSVKTSPGSGTTIYLSVPYKSAGMKE